MWVRAADQRILSGPPATIRATILDQDGNPADPGAVTVEIRSEATAAVVVPGGTATGAGSTLGEVTVDVGAAKTAKLDRWACLWTTGTFTVTTFVDVVGGFLVSVPELRADPVLSASKFSDADLMAARSIAEALFESEKALGRSFVPRYSWDDFAPGCGVSALPLGPPDLRAVRSVTGVTRSFTQEQADAVLPSPAGVARSLVEFPELCRVEWEHGADRPPADLKRACARYVRHLLTSSGSGIPDRATSVNSGADGGGTFILATPGMRGSIVGLPEVDEVLRRMAWNVPGIA